VALEAAGRVYLLIGQGDRSNGPAAIERDQVVKMGACSLQVADTCVEARPGGGGGAAGGADASRARASGDTMCYICFDDSTDAGNVLMASPCTCGKLVHRACLQRWIATKGSRLCSICKAKLPVDVTMDPPYIVLQVVRHMRGLHWSGEREYIISFTPATGHAVTVGTGVDCDVTLPDPSLSRRHARIAYAPPPVNAFTVEDCHSAAGTFIKLVRPYTIPDNGGAVFKLGRTMLTVRTRRRRPNGLTAVLTSLRTSPSPPTTAVPSLGLPSAVPPPPAATPAGAATAAVADLPSPGAPASLSPGPAASSAATSPRTAAPGAATPAWVAPAPAAGGGSGGGAGSGPRSAGRPWSAAGSPTMATPRSGRFNLAARPAAADTPGSVAISPDAASAAAGGAGAGAPLSVAAANAAAIRAQIESDLLLASYLARAQEGEDGGGPVAAALLASLRTAAEEAGARAAAGAAAPVPPAAATVATAAAPGPASTPAPAASTAPVQPAAAAGPGSAAALPGAVVEGVGSGIGTEVHPSSRSWRGWSGSARGVAGGTAGPAPPAASGGGGGRTTPPAGGGPLRRSSVAIAGADLTLLERLGIMAGAGGGGGGGAGAGGGGGSGSGGSGGGGSRTAGMNPDQPVAYDVPDGAADSDDDPDLGASDGEDGGVAGTAAATAARARGGRRARGADAAAGRS